VWKYYKKYDNISANCCFCEKIIKHSGNTTNLIQYISRKHEILISKTNKRKCDSKFSGSVGEIPQSLNKKKQSV